MKKGTTARLTSTAAAPKTVSAAGTRLLNWKPAWMDWMATSALVARSWIAAGQVQAVEGRLGIVDEGGQRLEIGHDLVDERLQDEEGQADDRRRPG